MRINIYSCPSCSATLNFRSPDTNVMVCHQCHTPLERWEDDVLKPLTGLKIPEDKLTPMQIGTTGVWQGKRFTVTGRLRCTLDEDYLNCWTIVLEGGGMRLLAEGYGHFAVYEKMLLPKEVELQQLRSISFGFGNDLLNLEKQYILERKNQCSQVEVEGEVWLFDLDGKFTMFEIAAGDGDRLALLDLGAKQSLSFRIHYEDFDAFNFQHLRQLGMGAVVKTLTCSQCKNSIELHSFPLSQSFSCKHCNSALSYQKGSITYRKRMSLEKKLAIPLYTKGTIKGVAYEMVGYAEKEDAEGYGWREYTLFNPVRGYAFLSEFNGHWIFLKAEHRAPVMSYADMGDFRFDQKPFLLYNKYTFTTRGGRGEFPGDVFNDGAAACQEYICPPSLWSREINKQGIEWYYGEHMAKDELYAAFGNNIELPYQIGIGAVQPVRGSVSPKFLRNSIFIIVFIFFILHIISTSFNKSEVVYEAQRIIADSGTTYSEVTQKFKLDKWRSNLEIAMTAPVSNNWLEANITLVNADNGAEYTMEQGVEYYSGYEDGESWSEGSTSGDQLFTSIPRGTYFMEIVVTKPLGSTTDSFTLKATYDVPMQRNVFVFVLIILLPGLGLYLYARNKEGLRWENSPFAPPPLFNFDLQ